MADAYLASQMAKLIEKSYKEKAVITYQLEQLNQQHSVLNAKIDSFTKSLSYIAPDFDFRTIQTKFDATKLLRQRLFDKSLSFLISEVFKRDNRWRSLHSITSEAMRLDKELPQHSYPKATRSHECAIGNVLRKLYKQGVIERQDKYLHYKVKKRGIFETSEWRLKPLEQG